MTGLQSLTVDRRSWDGCPPHILHTGGGAIPDSWAPGRRENLVSAIIACTEDVATRSKLVCKAWLDAFTAQSTTVPILQGLHYGGYLYAAPTAPCVFDPAHDQTPAQRMAGELRTISGLTNEEIAPLVGVSRRTLQAWIAGETISVRNENRLRAVLDAIRAVQAPTAVATRDRLLRRPAPHAVRAYELIAEQRYSAAVDLVLGRHPAGAAAIPSDTEPLDVQFGRIEESIDAPACVNLQLSRPLRR